MNIRSIVKHVALAFIAGGYGGSIPAWAADKPKLAIGLGVAGMVAHMIAYHPSINSK